MVKLPKHKRKIQIKTCPVCNGEHTYQLYLGTTYLFRGKLKKDQMDGRRHLTVVLECPVENTPFKAEIVIPMKTYLWISEVDAKPEEYLTNPRSI